MQQDALIVQGFAHGSQWLSPGVQVSAPQDTVRVWVEAGLAKALGGEAAPKPAKPAKAQASE